MHQKYRSVKSDLTKSAACKGLIKKKKIAKAFHTN